MKKFLFLFLCIAAPVLVRAQEVSYLEPWKEGYFDIHTISTGRGDATFLIFPDGTTMLIDTGDMTGQGRGWAVISPLPDATQTPARWVARYIDHFSPVKGQVDYMLLTHFHSDHMGSRTALREGPHGYRICGLMEMGEYVRFGKIVDRGWPRYDFPSAEKVDAANRGVMEDYRHFVAWQSDKRGTVAEGFEIGSHRQFTLKKKGVWDFDVWNLAANAQVTTGKGKGVRAMFTEDPTRFDENMFSCVTLFRYGAFKYYNGGDLPGMRNLSPEKTNRDYESQVADLIGPCSVIKADHHGYRDSCNPYFLWTLRPDVIIFPCCEASHPRGETVDRCADNMYPGKRLMYPTSPAGKAKMGEDRWAKLQPWGHVVVRVLPGGASYRVYVLDAESKDYRIKAASPLISSVR